MNLKIRLRGTRLSHASLIVYHEAAGCLAWMATSSLWFRVNKGHLVFVPTTLDTTSRNSFYDRFISAGLLR